MTDSNSENTNARVSSLRQLLGSGTMQQAGRMLNSLYPSEIADLLESLPLRERKFVWEMVDPDIEGEVLIELGEEVRDSVIQEMEAEEVIAAVEHLDADDMADLILSLPEAVIRETLASMDKQRLQQVEAVLSYPEDTAGGLMELNMVTIRPNVTVDVVLRYLRRLGELPSHTDRLFVVDRFGRYLGTVPLDKVLTRPDDTLIVDIIDARVEPVSVNMPEAEVARLFQDRDLISAPVVDEYARLLGRITIDDVVDVIVEAADKTVMSSAGLAEDEDIFAPIVRSTRRRSIWLGANLFTAFLAAWVIGLFEATIQQIVALAVLMPVVTSMGGVAGTQTLTLVIRAEALGQVGRSNIRSLLIKESAIGLLNGLLWALVVAVVATLWFKDIKIGAVIAVALIINLLFAAVAGVTLPFILRKMQIDPALAGGVILTTVTDVIGFMAFLGIATLTLLQP
ncbi:MAG: magnesium transporter [Gammaproteobacteria bacterium]|nr:magnesium transporter [Gammaproteobacteria bacterium]